MSLLSALCSALSSARLLPGSSLLPGHEGDHETERDLLSGTSAQCGTKKLKEVWPVKLENLGLTKLFQKKRKQTWDHEK